MDEAQTPALTSLRTQILSTLEIFRLRSRCIAHFVKPERAEQPLQTSPAVPKMLGKELSTEASVLDLTLLSLLTGGYLKDKCTHSPNST